MSPLWALHVILKPEVHNILQSRPSDGHKDARTHTHTHTRLTALCPGLPGWAGTRKVEPIWILQKQETVSGSGISWAICKSAPRFRQTTTPAPHTQFLPRDAVHPRYTSHGPGLSVCLSVCLSVRPSQVRVLLKRLNVGSHKQHHTIAQGIEFSEAKDLCEIRPGSPAVTRR